jgi:hypothetical protein
MAPPPGRPNHTLQRTGEQRWCAARWSSQRWVVVLPPPLSVGVVAPRQAWRLFPGERPCRVRARPPPVSSRASRAASEARRTPWAPRRPSILEAGGVTAPPAVLVALRQTLVADAEGGHAHRRPPTSRRVGAAAPVRRRPQAAAGRQRDGAALGRPPRRRRGARGGGW